MEIPRNKIEIVNAVGIMFLGVIGGLGLLSGIVELSINPILGAGSIIFGLVATSASFIAAGELNRR